MGIIVVVPGSFVQGEMQSPESGVEERGDLTSAARSTIAFLVLKPRGRRGRAAGVLRSKVTLK